MTIQETIDILEKNNCKAIDEDHVVMIIGDEKDFKRAIDILSKYEWRKSIGYKKEDHNAESGSISKSDQGSFGNT